MILRLLIGELILYPISLYTFKNEDMIFFDATWNYCIW